MSRHPRQTARRLAAAAVLVLVAGTAAACGGDESSGGPVVVEITFADGEVTPTGERVEAEVGAPIDLVVTADEPGTLHIHSDPEQELAYGTGEETFKIQVDRPGVVDVESHDLGVVIVQLEVS